MDDNLAIPKKSILPASVVAEKLIQRMNEVELHRHTGHSTGYTQLDQQGIRLQPGSVNIIAAHNGIGRYAFSSSLVLNFIRLNQKRVAICNIASDHETSVQALLHYEAGVKLPLIDGDNPSESDRSLLVQEAHSQWITQLDFILPNALTISAIEDQLFHLDDAPPSLLVIDSIKKLEQLGSDESPYSKHKRIADELHELATLHQLAILLLLDLPDENEPPSTIPNRYTSHLQCYGPIAHSANTIMFLDQYPDNPLAPATGGPRCLQLSIAQNHFGTCKPFDLEFVVGLGKFTPCPDSGECVPDENENLFG